MTRLIKRAGIAASLLALLAPASAAMASGGANSGGVNSGGIATGGGGAGGGATAGGGGGGGGGLTAAPCAQLIGVAEPVGYYSLWAAIWHHYTVKNCSRSTETVTVWVADTDGLTGAVDYSSYRIHQLASNASVGTIIDNDFAPFSTAYDVTTTVKDETGGLLATQTLSATTPPQL